MTAEIAILNREAIALASDSAVTVGQGTKIYNSANKIFTLSKFYPVGIMLFGNAYFMNIPWETVIKDYRKKFHDKGFNYLEDYAKDFLSYLKNNNSDISKDTQKEYVLQAATSVFIEIRNRLLTNVDIHIKENNQIALQKVDELLTSTIDDYHKQFSSALPLDNLPRNYKEDLTKEFDSAILSIIDKVFEKLTINKNYKTKLKELIYFIFTKQLFPNSTSGIVICGFGEKELFPSLISYNIESAILGNVKYKLNEHLKADSNGTTASIAPFAQGEMIDTFIRGIDPDYKTAIENFVKENLEILAEQIIENLDILKNNSEEKERIKSALKQNIILEITNNFSNQIDIYSQENHIRPIINSVGVLPKDELANMAETFINLTSFKRRVASNQKETVGGPIDVAVISKGDGFIWIKRKHYFSAELNQHFLRNYYNKKADLGDCNEKQDKI